MMFISYFRDRCASRLRCPARDGRFAIWLIASLAALALSSVDSPDAKAQTSRGSRLGSSFQNLDPLILELLQTRQTAPRETSQGVPSPVDLTRPGQGGRFQPVPNIADLRPSPLEADYAARLARLVAEFPRASDARRSPAPQSPAGPGFAPPQQAATGQAPSTLPPRPSGTTPAGAVPATQTRALPGLIPEQQTVSAPAAPPRLEQFGYRMLRNLGVDGGEVTAGAINDSYLMGIGDEVVVIFRGRQNQSYRTNVDREGRVILPEMAPISAAGRRFREFRAELKQRVSTTFLKTNAFVSLGKVRNFPVLVLGQVSRPGVHRLTGVASVLDAIAAAGGVEKTGSLRRIQIVRGRQVISVDLYDLLLTGRLIEDLSITEGDRIFVPTIGQTIAIAGDVQRPGIYELTRGTRGVAVSRALDIAGGTLRPQGYRYLLISPKRSGGDRISEIADRRNGRLEFGDILVVRRPGYAWDGAIFLDGHVSMPGPRALDRDRTVGRIIAVQDVLKSDLYPLFAARETTDPVTRARYFVAVDLRKIMAGSSDAPLRPNDRLIIFGAEDIRYLSSQSVQAVIGDSDADDDETRRILDCGGLDALANVVSRSRSERFANARIALNESKQAVVPFGAPCPEIFDRYPLLLPFVLDFVVALQGEIRTPGIYPVFPQTPIASLVPVAGGLSPDVDLSQIELSRFGVKDSKKNTESFRRTIDARDSSLTKHGLLPGDIVRFNSKFTDREGGSVALSGELKRPGIYTIRRGERLSELIARVGGMTEQAYPLGAVFTRIRVRQQEARAFQRAALDLESGLAEALASASIQGEDPGVVVAAVRNLAQTLRNTRPVGRVVVEADPTVLAVRPEFDTILEPGDRIHMPKRPNHVTVSGEILNPAAIQFRAGNSADEYIGAAGGVTRVADDGRTFVILPNGEAKSISVSSWNFTSVHIPPGSTIVVPRDPKPFDLLTFSTSIADILSKLAITAASLVVIGR